MSDSDKPTRPAIPAWQQKGADENEKSAPSDKNATSQATIVGTIQLEAPKQEGNKEDQEKQIVGTEEEIMDQVRIFLSQDAVKTAPVEKKQAFLESKGVSKEIIRKALSEEDTVAETGQNIVISPAEFKASLQQTLPGPQIQRDIPPVVTYPEFLVQSQKPLPLVTINRLLNTAYIAGALGTVFYGLSKYVIEPMKDNLTEARHDFAEHVAEQTNKLNEKLSQVTSTVPSTKPKTDYSGIENDDDSIASDPTELFHRDFGTQTEAEVAKPVASDSSDENVPTAGASVIAKQEERLIVMANNFKEVLSALKKDNDGAEKTHDQVTDLRDYLDTMLYLPPGQIDVWQHMTEKKKDDGVTALRAEIRGVKGVLLSAKRFPPSIGPAVRAGG